MSMCIRDLDCALREARRFIETAEAVRVDIANYSRDYQSIITGTARSGACRRASMDLTRALANLRRYR